MSIRFLSDQIRLRTTLKNQQQRERKDSTGKDSYRTLGDVLPSWKVIEKTGPETHDGLKGHILVSCHWSDSP